MATKNKIKSKQEEVKSKSWFSNKPVLLIIFKSAFIISLFFFIVRYIDSKGYFNPDERNNHTKRKWDSFYDFSENNNVDILLVGNSHLYSGINPINLSNTLGCNSFILASPGTNIADSYYGLKEALKRTQAKLVVVETYGIREFNPYQLKGGELSDQFKSFSARKDLPTKLSSTPFLFRSDNYLYAWSNTLRNHDFIFNDTAQLSTNIKLIENDQTKKKKLYLGRFVRFKTGIEEQIMNKYDSLGAPVNGAEYTYNQYTIKYVNKIVDLCKKEGIPLVFLTLPMYEKHVSDYDIWKERLSEILTADSLKWIDMQIKPGYDGFGPFAFENTYATNQHMTYSGSLLATYKLADYVRDSLKVDLPNRGKNWNWRKIFYGEEGYFENYDPKDNDVNNKIISSDTSFRDIHFKSLLHLDLNNATANKLMAKINKESLRELDYQNYRLRILLKVEIDGVERIANVDLIYDKFHTPKDEIIFTSALKPLKIFDIVDAGMIKNTN